ncbi:MAG: hypothetical protein JKP92_04550 [Alphaproteobacteria bacterium]|nr:hypothetical protein [Alphaproteobacteria bacterium]
MRAFQFMLLALLVALAAGAGVLALVDLPVRQGPAVLPVEVPAEDA